MMRSTRGSADGGGRERGVELLSFPKMRPRANSIYATHAPPEERERPPLGFGVHASYLSGNECY